MATTTKTKATPEKKKRRTTREIDTQAREIMRTWEAGERAAGRDPNRCGSYDDMLATDTAAGMEEVQEGSVTWAWWRCHIAAQRYG